MNGMASQVRTKVFFSDTFELPLPAGHRFPSENYRLLREGLRASFATSLNSACPTRQPMSKSYTKAVEDVVAINCAAVANLPLFSGFSNVSTVPAGNLVNASPVDAKTVNEPFPLRACARPASFAAASSVLKAPALSAATTMLSMLGSISLSKPLFSLVCP